ncbi:hypothetical protein IV203_031528 [Nitzschia inconspicua]|uniref:Uncharacterized protein n=1 Tax=Nitzschia inconspicua TaxID=303405 RepID=A0A9K3Q376_9STRA|nr:hypothetical protein IV203_031528 [Nitzschia inconspicua]
MASLTPQKISRISDTVRHDDNPKPKNQVSLNAYSEIVQALSKDMPLIMHGSGDVRETNPESELLLSKLTADYISNLVEAAVDAHAILNGGHRPPLPPPPPPYKKRKEPPLPAPYIWPADIITTPGATLSTKSAASSKKKSTKNIESSNPSRTAATLKSDPNLCGRRKRDVDYWDEPLPEPKIKNKPPSQPRRDDGMPQEKEVDGVKIGDWVGVAGVDFFPDSRSRSAHVTMPTAIGTQSFLFPVCHDAGLYGKILDIQSARRSLEPLLADTTIRDVIRNESGTLRSQRRRETKRQKPKTSNATAGAASGDEDEEEDDEPEETDSEDDELGAVWPGLEGLLPVHTTKDFLKSLM